MKQKITRIQAIPESPSQQQIFLNDTPFVEVHASLIEKFGLRIGLEIESGVIEKLIAADEVMRAKNYAIRLIREEKESTATDDSEEAPRRAGKPKIYTKNEMEQQLAREGFASEAIETAIAELIHSGYIRDRQYAENWVARRQKSNPRGKTLLKTELLDRGIDRATAEQVVAKVGTEAETEAARQLAEKRAKQYKRLPVHVAKRRLHGVLARRGFSAEVVRSVLEQIF